jgi:hypothetical protein
MHYSVYIESRLILFFWLAYLWVAVQRTKAIYSHPGSIWIPQVLTRVCFTPFLSNSNLCPFLFFLSFFFFSPFFYSLFANLITYCKRNSLIGATINHQLLKDKSPE